MKIILGNIISWAQEVVVWKLRFRRRLQRMKKVPCGVIGKRDLLIALRKREMEIKRKK